jgi:hypothetical protein
MKSRKDRSIDYSSVLYTAGLGETYLAILLLYLNPILLLGLPDRYNPLDLGYNLSLASPRDSGDLDTSIPRLLVLDPLAISCVVRG